LRIHWKHGALVTIVRQNRQENTMEIDVLKLKEMRDGGESVTLLDVREPHEVAICNVAGSVDIPMQQVPQRLSELPREGALVVMCHHGGRSRMVTNFLRQNGYGNAVNLAGGIDAWAQACEPGMARY
jgi:rhodanese-related sulfurtransferase